ERLKIDPAQYHSSPEPRIIASQCRNQKPHTVIAAPWHFHATTPAADPTAGRSRLCGYGHILLPSADTTDSEHACPLGRRDHIIRCRNDPGTGSGRCCTAVTTVA